MAFSTHGIHRYVTELTHLGGTKRNRKPVLYPPILVFVFQHSSSLSYQTMPDQKALLLEKKQGSLIVGTRPIPKPGPGQLLVKVRAAGLNPVDWKIQEYGIFVPEEGYPVVLGTDIAGDVVEVGEGVDQAHWPKGTRVLVGSYGLSDRAGFQQYTLIAADMAAKVPSNLSYSQAASISVAFVCAAYGIYAEEPIGGTLNPKWDPNVKYTGQHALVIGGSTSVGQYAIQILRKILGFTTVIAYASAQHEEHLKSLGATHVLDRHSVPAGKLFSAVRTITGEVPLKFVFDTLGGDEIRDIGYSLLGEGGQCCSVDPRVETKKENGKRQFGVLGIVHYPSHRPAGLHLMRNLEKWVADGLILPNRIYELPTGLEKIVEGLAIVKGNKAGGAKVIGHPED
ncbi:hypothetical protein V5O48_011558 [Marasmius crinis-equi]|uniref:Enoyl reductase (ER) domain-containing protein n=1 Tax=Marasmius crinis-equi TaxID=585013 RepID=A0ABR3F579_9AGAR